MKKIFYLILLILLSIVCYSQKSDSLIKSDSIIKLNNSFDQKAFNNYLRKAYRGLDFSALCIILGSIAEVSGPLVVINNVKDENTRKLGYEITAGGWILNLVGVLGIISASYKLGNAIYLLSPQGMTIKF